MTFRVEFTPEAEADLDRLFDLLLDRAKTPEDAMRAYEAVEAIRTAANSHCVDALQLPQGRPTPDTSRTDRPVWLHGLHPAVRHSYAGIGPRHRCAPSA
jgi:hypothetical protein